MRDGGAATAPQDGTGVIEKYGSTCSGRSRDCCGTSIYFAKRRLRWFEDVRFLYTLRSLDFSLYPAGGQSTVGLALPLMPQ